MELRVDLSRQQIELRERGDLKRFMVRALPEPDSAGEAAGPDRLDRALRDHEAGTVDVTGDALIRPEAIRRLARQAAVAEGSPLDPDWESEFSSMLGHAASKGWISGDGSVQAHIEWEE